MTQLGNVGDGYGVAVNSAGTTLYVSNYGQVEVFDSQGNSYPPLGLGLVGYAAGLAVNAAGTTLYAADQNNTDVLALPVAGGTPVTFGSNSSLVAPLGVAVDGAGDVYVADQVTGLVQVFNSSAAPTTQWNVEPALETAQYVAVDDAAGVVYVSDGVGEVGVYDKQGDLLGVSVGPNLGYNAPEGLAVWNSNLYVAEQAGGVVDKMGACVTPLTPIATRTNTFTPTPSLTFTPTPFLTPTPTFTPSLDNYGSWLQATDSAGFLQRYGFQMLYFNPPAGNGLLWVIGGQTNINNSGSLPTDVWSSPDGVNWTQATANSGIGTPEASAVLNGRMWVAGLTNVNGFIFGGVWYSSDGADWVETTAQAPWGPRSGFSLTAFNNQLWVIGGEGGPNNTELNDVWSSSDGVSWVQANAAAPFSARDGHQTLAFNGQLWVMGGEDFENGSPYDLSDVWSSSDGVSWVEASDGGNWIPRDSFMAAVEDGQMFVIGGEGVDQNGNPLALGDVNHSPDGVNWTTSTYSAPFAPRVFAGVAAAPPGSGPLSDHLWLAGGVTVSNPGNFSYGMADVWYSNEQTAPTFTPTFTPTPDANGQWTQAVSLAVFTSRSGAGLGVFSPTAGQWSGQNLLWMAGGYNNTVGALGDIWNSPDGVNWTQATNNLPWDDQDQLILAGFQGKLWAFNVVDYSLNAPATQQQVYNSPDGVNWTQVGGTPPFVSPGQVCVYNGKLYVIDQILGGGDPYGGGLYSSSDGISWQPVTTDANFPRDPDGASLVTYQGKMWLLGGFEQFSTENEGGDEGPLSTVETSTDGSHWQVLTYNAPMTIGGFYQAMAAGNVLYLVGSNSNPPFASGGVPDATDQWATTDGFHWTRVSAQTFFNPRADYAMASFNPSNSPGQGRLWEVGGEDQNGNSLGDIWTAPAAGFAPIATPTATPTSTQTVSPTPTGTLTPNITYTPTSSPTSTPTPSPTAALMTGRDWVLAQSVVPFINRTGQTTTAFNGSLWVIGGQNQGNLFGDGWNSPDGASWTQAVTTEPFGARTGQAAVSFNGQLWVIGGQTSQGVTNDVWNSPDGTNWNPVTTAPFSPRYNHQAVVFNGQLWVIGGLANQGFTALDDVWHSSDGVSWVEASNVPLPPQQPGFSLNAGLVFDGQLWVIGQVTQSIGVNSQNPGNGMVTTTVFVWSSQDGQNWTTVTQNAGMAPRTNFACVAADGRMWMIGGQGPEGNDTNQSGTVHNDV